MKERDYTTKQNCEYFYYRKYPYIGLAVEFKRKSPQPTQSDQCQANSHTFEKLEGRHRDRICLEVESGSTYTENKYNDQI